MTEQPAPHSSSDPDKSYSKTAIDRPINIALVFFVPLGLLIFCGFIIGVLYTFNVPMLVLITTVQLFAIVIPTIWLFSSQKWGMIEIASPRIPKLFPTLALIFFLSGFIVFNDSLTVHIIRALPESLSRSIVGMLELQAQLASSESLSEWVVVVLVVVFGPAIFEELLCRGLFLKACMQRMPSLPSIILNGIFFGVLHQNMIAFTYYFLIGVIFSWITLRTGTLIYGMILHALLNGTALALSAKYNYLEGLPIPLPIAIAGGICVAVAGLVAFHLTTQQPRPNKKAESI